MADRPSLGFGTQTDSTGPPPEKMLKQHFDAVPVSQQASGWDILYQKSQTLWDRAAPSPALIDTLTAHADLLAQPPSSSSKTRLRALVPGCGRGYDVLLLSSHGYDAVGLDTAETALADARALLASPELPTKYPCPGHDNGGRGPATFVNGDFFDRSEKATPRGAFDLIYDYTFLCALPPVLRPQWAERMSELLAPGGRLVCLEFPLGKDPLAGGPPHGLTSGLYVRLFQAPGREVEYDAAGKAVEGESTEFTGAALVRVAHWKAERAHAAGQVRVHLPEFHYGIANDGCLQGNECVSVWKHRDEGEGSCEPCQ